MMHRMQHLDVRGGHASSGPTPKGQHPTPQLEGETHPEILSHSILPSRKATLSIIQYSFTILPASQLLFSYSTH